MPSQTYTLSPVADSYVSAAYKTSVFGNSTVLRAGGGQYSLSTYISTIAFDTSIIPRNRVITDIMLKIYISGTFAGDGGDKIEWTTMGFPVVLRFRRVGYSRNEIESTLTYDSIKAKEGNDNVYNVPLADGDSSLMVNQISGTFQLIPIRNINRSDDDTVTISIFSDFNYNNAYSVWYNSYISSRESGSNGPVLYVYTEDYVPTAPTNLSPNATTRNAASEMKLSWNFADENMGTTQSAYEIQYSTNGFSTYSTVTGLTNNYHVLPVNTFSYGQTVQWKVRVTDTNGDVSAWSDISQFSIGNTNPSAPEIVSPINTIVNSSDVIYFRWKYSDLYGYTQSKFDFQYKKVNESETTLTVTSNASQFQMPAKTIEGGNYSWRVRTYNTFNEASPYSEWTQIYSIGKPEAPNIIDISNNMNPVISWHAVDQDVFRIKIYKNSMSIFDSGEEIGINTYSYTVLQFVDNGNYVLGISSRNIYGFWSDESLMQFTINTVKPDKSILNYTVNNLHVALIINSTTGINLLYRQNPKDTDFKLVSTLTSNVYFDYSVPSGEVKYFIRSVTSDGYNDSNIITAEISFKGIVISDPEDNSNMIHLWMTKDSDKRRSVSQLKDKYKIHFNGRTYPVSQSNEFKDHNENHEYFIYPDNYDKFYRIADSGVVLYRNSHGDSFKAEISNINHQENEFGYNVSFTLSRLEE